MKLEFNLSEISEGTLRQIAREVENVETIKRLADCPYYSVVRILVEKPETTKAIRGEIYSKWRGKSELRSLLNAMVCCPLDSHTIHSIIEWWGEPGFCSPLVSQEDILLEDLKFIYNILTTGNFIKEEVIEVLSVMAESDKLDQELMQKLVDYSPEVAAQIALNHSDVIRVDFSKRQTE